jgi:hypothetical protein
VLANFFAVAEMVAVTDNCATLPFLICRRLVQDPRLKILSAPVDLGTFPRRDGLARTVSPRSRASLAESDDR